MYRCPYCGSIQNDGRSDKRRAEYTKNNEINKNVDFILRESINREDKKVSESAKSLSNRKKVFMSIICAVIPGFGQIIGAIAGLAFMNYENDPDRKSFGLALLVASLIMFILSFLYVLIVILALFT